MYPWRAVVCEEEAKPEYASDIDRGTYYVHPINTCDHEGYLSERPTNVDTLL